MKTYGSIFKAETEGTICPVKESYYIRGALPIYYRGKEGGGKAWIIGNCVQRFAKIGGPSGGMGVGSRKSFGDDACRIRGMFLETNGVFRKKNFFNDKRLKKKLFISMNTICSSAKVRMN